VLELVRPYTGPGYTPGAGREGVLLRVRIENLSAGQLPYSFLFFRGFEAGGDQPVPAVPEVGPEALSGGQLAPRAAVTGTVLLEMRTNMALARLTYSFGNYTLALILP